MVLGFKRSFLFSYTIMSVCVTVETKKSIKPDDFLNKLADSGEKIVVTSSEFPCVKFGNHHTALRGIEVNQEEDGFEVRVCSFASVADYQLFAKTIDALLKLTGGKAYDYDDDDDSLIDDPMAKFNDEWIEKQRESSFMLNKMMSAKYGHEIILYGLFEQFSVGPKMYQGFNIAPNADYDKEDMDSLQSYLVNMQWFLAEKEGTHTRMMIPAPSGDAREGLTISAISIKDGKVTDFDYISQANLLAIFNMDDEESKPVLIPFEEAWKILPPDSFRPLDEYQYLRTGEVTVDMVHKMMEKAKCLQPEDLFFHPKYPGQGYDDTQNTVILMWNPSISSVTLEDHNAAVKRMLTEYFNWSVWDHKNAKCGDRFYLVKVGKDGHNGIVMSGVFDSQPYESDDWSGRGRQTFYMDMQPNLILNPDTAPMLTTEELMKAIPTFDWTGGHSGRILSKENAMKLEGLWSKYLKKHQDNVDGVNMNAIDLQMM